MEKKHVKVDFHCHTNFSHDCLLSPEMLVKLARKRGLDRLMVTDHDTIMGALAAKMIDPELVIIGEEIQTTEGELLAFFVEEEVPEGLKPEDAIQLLKDQNAFISVSHPFDRYRGWNLHSLKKILNGIDAIEVFNARCIFKSDNNKALEFAEKYHLHGTVGSDTHFSFEVGSSGMLVANFNDSQELRQVIGTGQIQGRLSPFWVHLFTSYAKLYKRWNNKLNGNS